MPFSMIILFGRALASCRGGLLPANSSVALELSPLAPIFFSVSAHGTPVVCLGLRHYLGRFRNSSGSIRLGWGALRISSGQRHFQPGDQAVHLGLVAVCQEWARSARGIA